MQWFHYECDGVQDRGFGCTYRSIQNAQQILGEPILSLKAIQERTGVAFRTWLEPIDVLACMSPSINLELVIHGRPGQTRGSRECYREVDLNELVLLIQSAQVCIVDNGTYTYAITDQGQTLLDPHTTVADQVARPIPSLNTFLKRSSGWMVAVAG